MEEIGLDRSDVYGETKRVTEYRERNYLIWLIISITPWLELSRYKKINRIEKKESLEAKKADKLVFAKNKKDEYIKEKQKREMK